MLERWTLEDLSDAARQVQIYALAIHQDRARQHREYGSGCAVVARLILIPVAGSLAGSADRAAGPVEDELAFEDLQHRILEVPFDPAVVRTDLDRRLRAIIARAEAALQRRELRAATARKLRFPYDAPRAPQSELMDAVGRGLEAGRPVLVQAPTGTGKTAGALLPALRFAMERDHPVYFATAKTTQRALAARTFLDIAEASGLDGRGLTAVTTRAKEQMCPPGHLLCHPDHCAYLADFTERAGRIDALVQLSGSRLHVAPEDAYRLGESSTLCPFELLLQAVAGAELVICDYNHVYDSRSTVLAGAAERTGTRAESDARAETDAPAGVVIIDEAHNLFDRARGYQSCFLGLDELDRIRDHLRGGEMPPGRMPTALRNASLLWTTADQLVAASDSSAGPLAPSLRDDLIDLCEDLRAGIAAAADAALGPLHVGELVEGQTPACDCCGLQSGPWNQLAGRAARLALGYVLDRRSHQDQGPLGPRDPVLAALETVGRIRDSVVARRPAVIPYVATRHAPGGAGFGVLCVDPAEYLSRCHGRAAGTVAMSATLEPLGYFADALGLAARQGSALAGNSQMISPLAMSPLAIAVESPFPAENRCVVVVPDVDTRYRERARHYRAIAGHIETIVRARPGRYAAFFPSFGFLARVREHLTLPPEGVLVQLPEMPQGLRDALLERFRDSAGPTLLCAVLGGAFAEGIDLPGDQLIGAIIVGPGLPALGFERVSMQRYFDERVGAGFEYAMLYPGMQRVVQAAGRVIRTAEDRGVIALLGRRFIERRHADCLPADWRQSDHDVAVLGGRDESSDTWAYDQQEGEDGRQDSEVSSALARVLARFWSS